MTSSPKRWRVEIVVADQDGCAVVDHRACVLGLVIVGRIRVGHEDAGAPSAVSSAMDVAPALPTKIRRADGRAHVVDVLEQDETLVISTVPKRGAYGLVLGTPATSTT